MPRSIRKATAIVRTPENIRPIGSGPNNPRTPNASAAAATERRSHNRVGRWRAGSGRLRMAAGIDIREVRTAEMNTVISVISAPMAKASSRVFTLTVKTNR